MEKRVKTMLRTMLNRLLQLFGKSRISFQLIKSALFVKLICRYIVICQQKNMRQPQLLIGIYIYAVNSGVFFYIDMFKTVTARYA